MWGPVKLLATGACPYTHTLTLSTHREENILQCFRRSDFVTLISDKQLAKEKTQSKATSGHKVFQTVADV